MSGTSPPASRMKRAWDPPSLLLESIMGPALDGADTNWDSVPETDAERQILQLHPYRERADGRAGSLRRCGCLGCLAAPARWRISRRCSCRGVRFFAC